MPLEGRFFCHGCGLWYGDEYAPLLPNQLCQPCRNAVTPVVEGEYIPPGAPVITEDDWKLADRVVKDSYRRMVEREGWESFGNVPKGDK